MFEQEAASDFVICNNETGSSKAQPRPFTNPRSQFLSTIGGGSKFCQNQFTILSTYPFRAALTVTRPPPGPRPGCQSRTQPATHTQSSPIPPTRSSRTTRRQAIETTWRPSQEPQPQAPTRPTVGTSPEAASPPAFLPALVPQTRAGAKVQYQPDSQSRFAPALVPNKRTAKGHYGRPPRACDTLQELRISTLFLACSGSTT